MPVDEDGTRATHSGYLHHAPNRFLFNSVWWDDVNDEYWTAADVAPGWENGPEARTWRRLARIPNPSDVIALIDGVSFFARSHAHRDAREQVGRGYEVIRAGGEYEYLENEYSHDDVDVRPAVFVDGHARALPAAPAWWLDVETRWRPTGSSETVTLWAREVRAFMWFTRPAEALP